MTQQSNEKTGPSKMAEGIALQRFAESKLPEDRRIFYDPYAVYFIDPRTLEYAKQNPLQAKALAEEYEKKMPGWSNSIRARVRYFDDRIEKAAAEGFTQLVILGAGYDTRAYRIPALKERMTIFEVDHPQTIERKISIITGIFQEMPKHVRFVPLDLEHGDLWDTLKRSGYSTSEKTLFVLEGLLMYLSRDAVAELFSGIAQNAGAGSIALFDFVPQSLVDGISDSEGGAYIRAYLSQVGELFRTGFAENELNPYLAGLGFTDVEIVPGSVYKGMIYTGVNADRPVSGLLNFAAAVVRG
ncbi:MAG: hypothetical protein ALMCE001_01320 [Methanocorpusculum sp. MCE]|nr:MAG: hypothetical protein ALMCE001_01320 [Methanocorpusculum sp. MCE]